MVVAAGVPIDAQHIETTNAIGKTRIFGQEHRGGRRELALFVGIHGLHGTHKTGFRAVSHFDKYKARIIEHDKVDFAATTAKIPANGLQALGFQILESQLLSVAACFSAYSSCVGSYQDSASVASGGKSSALSLKS